MTIGGNPAPVVTTNWSHTQIKCLLPEGQGVNQPVVVISGGQASLPGNFNYALPGITNVNPATGPTVGGAVITLRGTNFGTSGTVSIGGKPASVVTTNWSHTQIQCVLPPGQGVNQSVVVTTAGQSSPAASFNYGDPIITNVVPALVPTAGSNTITLWGTNFGVSGFLFVNGQFLSIAVTNWSDSEIKFLSPPGQGTNIPIFVITGGQSSPTTFYGYAPPGITNVSPSLGPEIGGITVTLRGTNFGTSGVVTVGTNGNNAIISGWSHNQIQFTLPPGTGTNVPVVVTVGGQISPAVGFNYFRPAITNVSPATGPTAGGSFITLKGMYFGTNGTVTIGGNNAFVASTNWSDTEIQCTLPAGQGTNVPVIVTSGGQASAPGHFSYFPPGIVNVSPLTGPTAGGATITLTGTNFGTSGVMLFNGSVVFVAATNWSDTQIRFALPAGQGTNIAIVVNTGGQASAPAYFGTLRRPSWG
ncbi:MAG: IPT/TIG domain-containing protein [Verrucomicrobiota bacterium]